MIPAVFEHRVATTYTSVANLPYQHVKHKELLIIYNKLAR